MKIVTVVGARPQFVKAAVLSRAIAEFEAPDIEEIIVHTGQHYDHDMSAVFFKQMHIPTPAVNLAIGGLSHGAVTGRMTEQLEKMFQKFVPDVVLVYGDTNSTLAGALAASQLNIPVAHIEAGLRSFNREMPEEKNRVLTDHLSSYLFCPTKTAVSNLEREGIGGIPVPSHEPEIHLVGDVMYDAALYYAQYAPRKPGIPDQVINAMECVGDCALCTIHRQENTDDEEALRRIVLAMESISKEIPIVLPLHPRTKKCLEEYAISIPSGVYVVPPLSYFDILALLKKCSLVLTDSGGLQKEAFFFGKPCVVLRNQTEWVELVQEGWNILAGADEVAIFDAYKKLQMTKIKVDNLFGCGEAGRQIVKILHQKIATRS